MAAETEIQKQREIQLAFESYQRAAQNREKDPDTFEATRFRYYGLKNGEGWIQQEKKRINDSKLGPVVDTYRSQYTDLQSQDDIQRAYTDSIAMIRNKQSSLKSGISSNIDYLKNLLADKEQKVSAYDRFIQLTDPHSSEPTESLARSTAPIITYFASFPPTFIIILDIVLAVLVIFLLVLGLRKGGMAFKSFNFADWFTPKPTPITPTSSL